MATLKQYISPKTKQVEQQVPLGSLSPGQFFRFANNMSFEETLENEDAGALFFQVINVQPKETGRTSVVTSDGGQLFKKDSDRLVIIHDAEIILKKAQTVEVEITAEAPAH